MPGYVLVLLSLIPARAINFCPIQGVDNPLRRDDTALAGPIVSVLGAPDMLRIVRERAAFTPDRLHDCRCEMLLPIGRGVVPALGAGAWRIGRRYGFGHVVNGAFAIFCGFFSFGQKIARFVDADAISGGL